MRRASIVVAIAAAIAALAFWLFRPQPPAPRDPHWTARAWVLAGDGAPGVRDGGARQARFADPFGVAVAADGSIYVADGANAHRIRRISPDGVVSTVAGGERGFADGSGAAARFDTPSGLAIDDTGILYVADTGNDAIRRVTPDGNVSTLARGLNGPIGIAVGPGGRIVVADTYADRICVVGPDGSTTALEPASSPLAESDPARPRFHTPSGVAIDPSGNLLVADTGNGLVKRIDAAGVLTSLPPPPEGLFRPVGIAAGPEGAIYVTDERGRIITYAADGSARVLAGWSPGFRDGASVEARFRNPRGVAVAGEERLIVADSGNALVRLVASSDGAGLMAPSSPRVAPAFDADAFALQPLLWPVWPASGPHEIAGTAGEVRGGAGFERFHTGIDIRADEGAYVHAIRDGVVLGPLATSEFGTLNEAMRIGPLVYVHMRAGRTHRDEVLDPSRFVPTYGADGRLILIRVRRGARFRAGEAIGTVNRFNHVHLNVGWAGEEYNPLRFRLPHFEDTIAPTIARGGIRAYDEAGAPITTRRRGRLLLSGRVQIVVDAWDQAEGNRPNRRLGLYELGYQVLNADGSHAPAFGGMRHTMRFDRLPANPEAARLVYAAGSGIPFFGGRRTRFLYNVTNTFRGGFASQGWWDTGELPPGDYILRVRAADVSGNEAMTNRDVPVTVVAPGAL